MIVMRQFVIRYPRAPAFLPGAKPFLDTDLQGVPTPQTRGLSCSEGFVIIFKNEEKNIRCLPHQAD